VWQSADPILGRYIGENPEATTNGGVFNSRNLGLYSYAYLSPIRYGDPDGLGGWDRVTGGLRMAGGFAESSVGATVGFAFAWTGVAAVGGGILFVHGADQAATGFRQMISGQPETSLTSYALQSAGVSRSTAESLDTALSVGGTLGASAGLNAPRLAATVGATSSAGAATTSNTIPETLARVIPGKGPFTTLGRPGAQDVFVTGAEDIAGLSAKQIAQRLTIGESKSFTVIEFPSAGRAIASPVNRSTAGFVGGGRTAGGAREFVIPNEPVPTNANIRVVE